MQYRSLTDLRYAYLLFGERAIFDAGIALFDFPGTWVVSRDEGTKIREYLESSNDNNNDSG